MKIQRFMTWPLAVTLAGVVGLVVVALAPPTAEASFQFPGADIQCVNKTVTPGLVNVGDSGSFTYVVTVRNNGPDPAENVMVTDTLPTDAVFSSASTSQGPGCGAANATITCDLGTLAANTQATVTIVVDFTNAMLADTFNNFASVTTSTTETDSTNNGGESSDCDVSVIVREEGTPNLVCLGKTAAPTTLVDGTPTDIVYTVTIRNTGDATAINVQVKDTLTVIAASDPTFESSNVTCDKSASEGLPTNTVITCDLGNLDANTQASVVVTVNVADPMSGDSFADSAVASATGVSDSNACTALVTVPGGGEGCTPGGWRNHEGAWPAPFDPVLLFNDAVGGGFMNTVDDDLVQGQSAAGEHDGAIWFRGGGNKKRYRHGMACLLNAASPVVDYDLTEDECKDIIRTGSSNGFDINDVADFNEQGCDAF